MTRITLWSRMGARGAAGRMMVPLVARRFLRRSIRFCESVFIEGAPPPRPFAPPPKARASGTGPTSPKAIENLRDMPVEDEYALELQRFIATAGEDEVASMRPFEWADNHGFDRHEALRLCLYAVRVGLLNLRWSMMCPNCRVCQKTRLQVLTQVSETVHCDVCGVNYDLEFRPLRRTALFGSSERARGFERGLLHWRAVSLAARHRAGHARAGRIAPVSAQRQSCRRDLRVIGLKSRH